MRKMVKIVHGVNRETEMSRANKPVMYLDFDGVLNAFPNTGIVNYSDVGHVELVPDPDGYRTDLYSAKRAFPLDKTAVIDFGRLGTIGALSPLVSAGRARPSSAVDTAHSGRRPAATHRLRRQAARRSLGVGRFRGIQRVLA